MSVRVEITGADEVWGDRCCGDLRRRKKRRVSACAVTLALLCFGSVRVDRVDVAAQQRDYAAAVVSVAANQIRHAVFIEIGGSQTERLSQIPFQRLPQLVGADVGRKQIVAV